MDSPAIQLKFGTISAGSKKIYDAINSTSYFPASKYAPWNILRVFNNSNENITVYINDKPIPIQSKTFLGIEKKDKLWWNSIAVENNGSSDITDTEVIIYLQRIDSKVEEWTKKQRD